MNPKQIARHATAQNFLNCYLNETETGEFVSSTDVPAAVSSKSGLVVRIHLPTQDVNLYIPVLRRSVTNRHLFDLPGRYRTGTADQFLELDYLTLATLLTKELTATRGTGSREKLLRRIIESKEKTEKIVRERADDTERLYAFESTFREAEQSLLFGHLMHPTPKSRKGIPPHKIVSYAPEFEASFRLHYFRADPELVTQKCVRDQSAHEWVVSALQDDPAVAESILHEHAGGDGVLLPVHPWQADYLLEQERTQELLAAGRLESVGQLGREFYPTSSVRTLYEPNAPFMVKGSLNVKITNLKRRNKYIELERGIAASELLLTEVGDTLEAEYPNFSVIPDLGYLTLSPEVGLPGFEVILRHNPFHAGSDAAPVVALCQDGMGDHGSRLETIVRTLARKEDRSTAAVSVDWFENYLERCVNPIVWLLLNWGICLEAHQQNVVVELDSGYPSTCYYRDNQGYYISETLYDDIDELVPGLDERVGTVCSDELIDERLQYYLVVNNAFGLINAFGTAGVVEEQRLLAVLRDELESLTEFDRASSDLLQSLLHSETIRCKGNLLTRFQGLDELEADSLADQAVYVDVPNPLVQDVER